MGETTDLKGRRALVTGADGEVGRAVALRLAKAGMRLALVGCDAAALMRTAALTGRPLDMLVLPADLARERELNDVLHVLEGHFKGLDALVNTLDGEPAATLSARCLALRGDAVPTIVALEPRTDEGPEAAAERAARPIAGGIIG